MQRYARSCVLALLQVEDTVKAVHGHISTCRNSLLWNAPLPFQMDNEDGNAINWLVGKKRLSHLCTQSNAGSLQLCDEGPFYSEAAFFFQSHVFTFFLSGCYVLDFTFLM